MVTTRLRLKIHYAPLPEENTGSSSPPAALAYCQRAARLFLSLEEGDHVQMKREVLGIEPLPDDASRLFDTATCNQEDGSVGNCNDDTKESTAEKKTTTRTLHLLIISCAADGSVHRSVRKFARSIAKVKMDNDDDNSSSSFACCCNWFALTLLGHARCDNSAKQMADTIYSAGRRLEKSLLQTTSSSSSLSCSSSTTIGLCETQVELEGPDVKFDPWILVLVQSLASSNESHNT